MTADSTYEQAQAQAQAEAEAEAQAEAAASATHEQVSLRPMVAADVDVLLPFEQQMFGSEAWSRRSYLEEIADTELRYYLVASTADGHLLGNAGLLMIGGTAQILTVGVLPNARRRGIGRLLVRALVTEAQRRCCGEVLLEVRIDNNAARKLYEAEGFQQMGLRRGYYDRGRVDALTLRLPLPPSLPLSLPLPLSPPLPLSLPLPLSPPSSPPRQERA